ncbi:serine/threonine-protein kinase [Streptomyces smyrnaeus]|uniref:serine/threonine-protein kinase n=1 Tax=Streptomyces smyrnaeus TaxID=1387713 RepID=UPI0037B5B64C
MSEDAGRLVGGRYRLGGVLGRGGMGTVWRGEDEILGRRVAVKELRFPSSVDEEEKQRLITRTLREAKAIARIRSGSAITVFDVVNEDSRPWIVMELVEGRSLADKIKNDGPLEPQRAAEVGLAILDVLRAAHREGILHRDVKPSNVLLEDGTGRVVLTDFGIAKVEGDPSVTSTGMLVGAPSYISPERARGKPPGPPADLWSLGGLLFAAVEGRPPYDKGSAISTLTAVMTEPVPYPEHAGELSEVIAGLLVKDPEKRLDVDGARLLLEPVANGHKSPPGREADGPAERTSILPPVPSSSSAPAPSGSASPGRSGGPAYSSGTTGGRRKRRSEGSGSGERLRGAFKSVRNAAAAGGAGAAGASSAGAAGRTGTGSGSGSGSRSSSPSRGEGSGGAASGGTRSGPRHGGGSAQGAAPSAARASATPPAPTSPPRPSTPPASSPGRHSVTKGDGASERAGGRGVGATGAAAAGSGATGTGTGTGATTDSGPGTGGSGGAPLPVPGTGSGGRALPPESGGSDAITSLRDLRELPELRKGLSRRTLAIAAAVVVAVILVIVLIVANLGDDSGGGGGNASNGGSADTSADGQGGVREGEQADTGGAAEGDGKSSGGGQNDESGDDEKGDSALPDGYAPVKDGRFHFSVALPDDFERAGIAGKNSGRKYAASGGGYPRIQIDHTSSPGADAVGAWRKLEPAVKGSSPGYKSLGIKKVEWRGYPTVADWQFLRKENGKKVHALNRGFKVDGANGYAILITCEADAWQEKECVTLRKTAFKTFKPRA